MGVLVKNGKSYTGTGDLLIQPVIYSDDERCIGVWRDGKPLYRKTISGRTPSSSYNFFGDSIANFEHCYYYEGVIIPDDANGTMYSIFYNRPDNNNAEYYVGIENNGKVFMRTYSSQASTFYVTIFYTKTTDTAGTAAWVPTGATPIHYSLNEQVIGTWIDGKPLYQKTIAINNTAVGYTSSVHTEVPHNITDLKECHSLDICSPVLSVWGKSVVFNSSNGSVIAAFAVDSTKIYSTGGGNHYAAAENRWWYFTLQYTKTTD